MTRLDDRIAKPSAGRLFPVPAGVLASHIERLGFAVHSYHSRLPILLENCSVECDRGHQLCSFMRMGFLAVFSLPEWMPQDLAKRCVERAVEHFAVIDGGPRPATRAQQFVIYRAFVGPLGTLSVTQHVVHGGQRAYLQFRGATQLSGSERSTQGQRELLMLQVS